MSAGVNAANAASHRSRDSPAVSENVEKITSASPTNDSIKISVEMTSTMDDATDTIDQFDQLHHPRPSLAAPTGAAEANGAKSIVFNPIITSPGEHIIHDPQSDVKMRSTATATPPPNRTYTNSLYFSCSVQRHRLLFCNFQFSSLSFRSFISFGFRLFYSVAGSLSVLLLLLLIFTLFSRAAI
jgi:hypothetical protein